MLISIVMSVYNGERFLDAAIKSVIQQTYNNWELFIVDDGSRDGSLEKALEWTRVDTRIKVLQHEGGQNKKVSATRNLGIQHANSKFVALIDCDDLWLPEKLMCQIEVLEKYPEIGVVYSKAETIDASGNLISEERNKTIKTHITSVFGNGFENKKVYAFTEIATRKFNLPTSSILFNKEHAASFGYFQEDLPYQFEDSLFVALLSEVSEVFFIDKTLVLYRVHESQWSAKVNAKISVDKNFLYNALLLNKVNPRYHPLIAKRLVRLSFRRVVYQFINVPTFDLKFVSDKFLFIYKSAKVPFKEKLFTVYIFLERFAVIPITILKKTFGIK